jgi:serine/threonine-protein kinase
LPSVRDHQLDTLLHRGTTAEVWRATRLGPNGFAVPVAIKTLTEACSASPDQVRSFLKESRAASSVQHPNVVQVRELIFDGHRYWLTMDLVAGWPLRMLISAIEASGQRIPIQVALSLVRDAVRGLTAVHDAGLVHRGVSPDNLMVTATGQLVVLDFGLATWQQTQRIRFTPPIEMLDPDYSSPELRARLPVDARTDVFSLGALLDQLIPEARDAPIALDAIIARALDADAGRRFASAQSLEAALDLVSIREGWMMPASYIAAYLNDVFRSAAPPDDADRPTAQIERGHLAPPIRTVLPRSRRGMVGVGTALPGARGRTPQ